MTISAVYDLESLRRAVQKGARPRYLFFWGHTSRSDRIIGNECLSQWYAIPFRLDGYTFPTAEHYMMFQKAMLFGDDDCAEQILASPSPKLAKALGRSVRGFNEATWAEKRMEIVVAGSEAKFGQNPMLRAFLLSTAPRILVEASPTDRIWGIGLAQDHDNAANPLLWKGLNLLGFALMIARSRLAGGAT